MIVPFEFGKVICSVADGTRPSSGMGATVTPGNNTYGSYAQMIAGSSVTDDVYGVWLNFHGILSSGLAKDALVTIGIDAAGGTSYTDWITDILASCASSCGGSSTGFTGGGCSFYFPVFLRAGASIAAKASVNNATVGTARAHCKLYCKPSLSQQVNPGTFVQTFGATTASSSGTVVTPGTVAEGAWTEIGTLTKPLRWLEYGIGINSATMTANTIHVDVAIGDASNKKVVIQSEYVETNTVELITKYEASYPCVGAVGAKIYARAQVGPNAADSNVSVCVYGVG
jgi:hypothetical protein